MRIIAPLIAQESLLRDPNFQLAFDVKFNNPMREKCPSIP
jgi:hypothetical protein